MPDHPGTIEVTHVFTTHGRSSTGTSQHRTLREALADLRNTAREQMMAAWQIHVEQLQEQLAGGWPERIAWIFEERFRELQTNLEQQYRALVSEQVAAAISDARATVRRDLPTA